MFLNNHFRSTTTVSSTDCEKVKSSTKKQFNAQVYNTVQSCRSEEVLEQLR